MNHGNALMGRLCQKRVQVLIRVLQKAAKSAITWVFLRVRTAAKPRLLGLTHFLMRYHFHSPVILIDACTPLSGCVCP